MNKVSTKQTFANERNFKSWMKTLEQGEGPAKEFWLKSLNQSWDYDVKLLQLQISRNALDSTELLPIITYRMDSLNFLNFERNKSIDKLLILDQSKATYYVTKDKKIVSIIYYGNENGNWYNSHGYSGIFPEIASKIENTLFELKGSIYKVYVYLSNKNRPYRSFTCYYDGKEFYSIRSNGSTALLRDELLKAKEDMINQNNRKVKMLE